MGEFSGRTNNCKNLSKKADSLECLTNSDKMKWLEIQEEKEKNRKLAQRSDGCYITWDPAGSSFE